PRGKPEKKAVFSPHRGDETTTCYNRAFALWPVAGASAFLMFLKAVPLGNGWRFLEIPRE
ncbi:hypothetical protein, partial [uncultured Bilophila sp.]|uniref:hypothetical protein n=1 Tax=uncultured Bilophila sp. TaxID=529385 RepID=UPI00280C3B11